MRAAAHLRIRFLLAIIGAVALLALGVGAALAATPNDVQYNTTTTTQTNGSGTKGVSKSSSAKPKPSTLTSTSTGGTLPFTGLDLGVMVAAAALVLAGGFGLRRLGRKNSGSTE